MTRYFFIIIMLAVCSLPSCAAHKREVIAASNIKLEGRSTNIRSLLDIDGYYSSGDEYKTKSGFMFFEDGTFVYCFFKNNATEEDITTNMSFWIYSLITNKGIGCGVYRLEGDTIIVHEYGRSGLWWKNWSVDEVRLKIINRTTVQRIYVRSALKSDDEYYKINNISPWKKNDSLCQFVSCDFLPSSDCWLKEEKWIWRNESDWKAYMQKIERKKIKE